MTLAVDDLGFASDPTELEQIEEPEYEEATQTIAADAQQIQESARNSLDFLAALAMPDVYKYAFPIVFTGIWQWLSGFSHKVRDFSQIALGLPRGFSKTTVLKLFILYCILFTKKSFILYIGGTQTKANDVIGDVTDMLDEPNIKATFGDWRIGLVTDRADFKLFGFRGRNIILRGAGAGSDIRGITRKNRRPDVMIFDDVQTREDADSQVISDQIENWMQGTAMKAKSPEGCLYIFLANMYPTKFSILKRLKPNPNWLKFIVGGITEDGKSLWEELHPINQLLKEFQNDALAGKANIFYSEVLNDENATVANDFDLTKVPAYAVEPDEMHQGNAIIIDPSNDKENSDACALSYMELHQGIPCAVELHEGRWTPKEVIEFALELALRKNCRVIGIEANAYQYSLIFWFQEICREKGIIGIEAVELYTGKMQKTNRILDMLKQYMAGEIQIHPKARPLAHNQIGQYNPMKSRQKDGILDCLTYMPKMVELYAPLMKQENFLEMQEHLAIKIPHESESSAF
jgi:hypothetical protein